MAMQQICREIHLLIGRQELFLQELQQQIADVGL